MHSSLKLPLPLPQTDCDVIRLPADRASTLPTRAATDRERGLPSALPLPTRHYAACIVSPGPPPPSNLSMDQLTGYTTRTTTSTRATTTVTSTTVQNVMASDVLSYDARVDSALSTGRMLLQHSAFSVVPVSESVHVSVVTAPSLTTPGRTVHGIDCTDEFWSRQIAPTDCCIDWTPPGRCPGTYCAGTRYFCCTSCAIVTTGQPADCGTCVQPCTDFFLCTC